MSSAPIATKQSLDVRSLGLQCMFVALVLAFPFGIGTAAYIFRDGDVSWHIAAGRWILQHGHIPTTDPFSFTAAGHPWVAMEWLGQILFAEAYQLAGYSGVAVLVGTAFIGTNAVIFFYLQRRVSPIVVAVALLAMDILISRSVSARPYVLVWPLLAGWTVLLLRADENGRPPPLWSALILLVWTNLHASFPIALAAAGAIGFDALTRTGWSNLRAWLAFGIVSLIAVMLNANGAAGLLQPFSTASMTTLHLIAEWAPTTPNNSPLFIAALLAGIGGLLASGTRIPVGRLSLLLVLLALALAHVRHQSSFVIVAACIVPTLWTSSLVPKPVPTWLLAAVIPIVLFRLLVPVTPPENAANPRHLIAAIPRELKTQPVFNEYTFGGPLILAGVRPFIDGRTEIYGDAFFSEFADMADGNIQLFDRAVERYGIRWVMLDHRKKSLATALDASGKWRKIYSDRIGVIYIRRNNGAAT